ncbi:MAG: hypothetical protein ABL877_07300 [Thiobacillus sp.]
MPDTPFLKLARTCAAWGTPAFGDTFKAEVAQLDAACLPLQQGLKSTSSVADEPFSVLLMSAVEAGGYLRVKAGICYAGITGGCSCADDPTPLDSQPEYCELWFEIDRQSGVARVELVAEA